MGERKKALGKKKSFESSIGIAVLLSLLFHGLLFFFAPELFKSKDSPAESQEVSIVFREAPNKKAKDPDAELPVVALAPQESPRPQEAKVLAEHDRSALKETIAKSRSETQVMSDRPEKRGAKALEREAAQPQEANKKPSGLKVSQKGSQRSGEEYLKEPRTKTARDPLGLRIPPGNGQKNAMPFNDFVPGVQEGDETALNAWQWRHASFFNRIKKSIAGIWAPNVQIQRFDPGGNLLGHKDRITVMQITIDKEGKMTALSVASGSGVHYLDDEALRAFKEAAPFPFPPQELFKKAEEFTFNFAFHVQIDRGLKLGFDWNSGN